MAFLCARTMAAVPLELRIGFPAYAFSGLNANDSETVTTFYLKRVAEDLGLKYSARIYPDRHELYRDMNAGKLDMVLLSSSDICDKDSPKNFPSILAPLRGEDIGESIQLLVHRDSDIKTLADLRGRHLLSYVSNDAILEIAWLNRELAKQNLPPAPELFRNISHPEAASKTVLPVFFRKADACLITKSLFDILGQLNPQLQQRLVPLANSELLLSSALCLRADYSPEGRRRIMEAACNLASTPHGRQLITLTKLNRIIPFKPEMLHTVEKLLIGSQNLATGSGTPAPSQEPRAALPPDPAPVPEQAPGFKQAPAPEPPPSPAIRTP
ncbi:MAG: hypothetical protein JWL81_3309 [Verrucomicrobiales bacterium]|nr:hypothetical protein [Verrucomicrobiales bacterium]